MSEYTSKLNLYKVDPATDGDDTFDIKTMLNDNWDKVDNKVGVMGEKLDNIEDNANNYIHPTSHTADMITINDVGNEFSGGNVEEALQEVGSQMADISNVIIATGTANAITLTLQGLTTYRTNMLVTFIASADNNGTATTIDINGIGIINLYKPNTTDAPTLKSGKAYELWYDGTNFFLKASATGDASPSDVLAGKIFSNDDGEQIGTKDLSNLIESNIRDGVDIGGVMGSLIPLTNERKCASGTVYKASDTNIWYDGLDFTPSNIVVFNIGLEDLIIYSWSNELSDVYYCNGREYKQYLLNVTRSSTSFDVTVDSCVPLSGGTWRWIATE